MHLCIAPIVAVNTYIYVLIAPIHIMHSEIHEYNDKPRKLYTEIYPVDLDTGRVILGYKRRGFGVGKCMFPSFFLSILVSILGYGICNEHCADCN